MTLAYLHALPLRPLQLVDWSTAGFVSLTEHCRYKYLLHVPGNTYSGEQYSGFRTEGSCPALF
jgi:hypothetical protein